MSILNKLWNAEDFFRALLWASIVGIIYFTIVGVPDWDLYLDWKTWIIPYGQLWYVLNPYFGHVLSGDWLYSMSLTLTQAAVVIPQWILARRNKLSRNMIILNLFTTFVLRAIHAQQDVTIIMFAPFGVNWWSVITVSALFFFQKIPIWIPWNQANWDCAFNGTGTGLDTGPNNVGVNQCLANSVKLNAYHVYSMSYVFIAMWFLLPIIIQVRKSWRNRK